MYSGECLSQESQTLGGPGEEIGWTENGIAQNEGCAKRDTLGGLAQGWSERSCVRDNSGTC